MPPPTSFDFGIVTVLDEARGSVARLLGLQKEASHENVSYAWDHVEGKTVACGKCPELNLPAEAWAMKMIRVWRPRCLLLVDIGGGVWDREDIQLGDVVVHKFLHAYEPEKQASEVDQPRYLNLQPPAASLLEAVEGIRNASPPDWTRRISITRPAPGDPKIVLGELLSGDKLLSNPEHDLVKELLERYPKAVAVDMESAGIAHAAWATEVPVLFLVARGISDFFNYEDGEKNQVTRDIWRTYAAETAAALSGELVARYELPPARLPWQESYLNELYVTLDSSLSSFGDSFNIKLFALDRESGKESEVESLKGFLECSRKSLLTAVAGGGKSVAVARLALQLALDRDCLPVLVDLKRWKTEWEDRLPERPYGAGMYDWINTILLASLQGIGERPLRVAAEKQDVVLIVDGLNEVRGENMANLITLSIEEWLRQTPSARAILTDRAVHERYSGEDWSALCLSAIESDEVEACIDRRFGRGAFAQLTEKDQKRLSTPFFLRLSIGTASSGPQVESRGEAMTLFFSDQLKLSAEDLAGLAEAAFREYQGHNRTFEGEEFRSIVGNVTFDLLFEAGVVVSRDDQYAFEHQLYHDYLAARYLASHEEHWVPESLDDITFKASSTDPLPLTLGLIEDIQSRDTFLRAVHDWNWNAALSMMAALDEEEQRPASKPLELALLSLAAERRFDPVSGSAKRTDRALRRFSLPEAKALREPKNLAGLLDRVLEFDAESGTWFSEWRAAFTRRSGTELSDEEFSFIWGDDSVLGWTIANVLRRFEERPGWSAKLAAAYAESATTTPTHQATRWRVVHAIGRWRTTKNVELLLSALDNDHYMWVRYGAMRSLIEIAALADDGLRKQVLVEVKPRIESGAVPEEPLSQVVWSAMRSDAVMPWPELIRPMIVSIQNRQQLPTERGQWERRLERFDDFWRG